MLSIKESYLFLRNSLGLVFHPFKTWRALLRQQDFSQILLLLGFPAYILVGGLGLIWFGRKVVEAPAGDWGFFTKSGIMVVFFSSVFVFGYLGYWLYKVWKVKEKFERKS